MKNKVIRFTPILKKNNKDYGSEFDGWQIKDNDSQMVTNLPMTFSLDASMFNTKVIDKWGSIAGQDIDYGTFFTDFVIGTYYEHIGGALVEYNITENSIQSIWNDANIIGAPSDLVIIDNGSPHIIYKENDSASYSGAHAYVDPDTGYAEIVFNAYRLCQSKLAAKKTSSRSGTTISNVNDYEIFKAIGAHEIGHVLGLRDLYLDTKSFSNSNKLMYGYYDGWTIDIANDGYLTTEDILGVQSAQDWGGFAGAGSGAISASYLGISDDELYSDSDLIVEVIVNNVGDFDSDIGIPKSMLTADVLEVIKGNDISTVQFLHDGKMDMEVIDNPLLKVNQQAILFLKISEEGLYYINGGPQGKYYIDILSDSKDVYNQVDITQMSNTIFDDNFAQNSYELNDIGVECDIFKLGVSEELLKPAPEISYSISQNINEFGWYNESVQVEFENINPEDILTHISDPVVLLEDGESQYVNGYAINQHGKRSDLWVGPINIDSNMPIIEFDSIATYNGEWLNHSLAFESFISDSLSGVREINHSWKLSLEQTDEVANDNSMCLLDKEGIWYNEIEAIDYAGNQTSKIYGPYMIDLTVPEIVYNGKVEMLLGEILDINYEVSDKLSGIHSTTTSIDDESYNMDTIMFETPGVHSLRIEALDNAGNRAEMLVQINVILPVDVVAEPGSLNLKSGQKGKAQITLYLQFPEGYDITKINPDSITLNNTVYSINDEKFGYVKNPFAENDEGDLCYVIKFYRSDLSNILESGINEIELYGKTDEFDFFWAGEMIVK